ncbi:MAG: TonB-dependent receptor [Acidobacteriota bacterium]
MFFLQVSSYRLFVCKDRCWRLTKQPLLIFKLILTYLLLTSVGTAAQGQSAGSTSANLAGTVSDEQGGLVGSAVVTVRNVHTNIRREIVTDSEGEFFISQLPPGHYKMAIEKEGFASQTRSFDLELGRTILFNFILSIDKTEEVVEVKSQNLTLLGQTENSTNIDGTRIDTLPINRRDFLDFSLTAARVSVDRLPSQGVFASSGLSFNGQSGRFNNITIDGLDNNDPGPGAVRSIYSQAAVQEFQVVSDSYSAEFGRALGGIINIVTKSGSNEFHGSLFSFLRNDELSARNAFANIDPQFAQYQFGATFSGPIKQDRVFFFTAFERLSVRQNNIVTISNESITSARQQGFLLRNGPIPFSIGTTSLLARGDVRLTPNDNLFVRFNASSTFNDGFEPFGGLIGDTSSGKQRLKDKSLAINNTYINASRQWVNETRFLFGRRKQQVLPLDDGPQVRILAPEGLIGFGRGAVLPQVRLQNDYQIVNNTTLSRGRNQIRFGVDYLYLSVPKKNLSLFPGGFAFFRPFDFTTLLDRSGLPTFTALESFDPRLRTPAQRAFLTTLGAQLPNLFPGFPRQLPLAELAFPDVYIQGFGDTKLGSLVRQFSAFYQQDIKLATRMLLKAGLRYDLNRVIFIPKNNGNLSPRLAFSYQIPNANLILRGSYGLFFGVPLIEGIFESEATISGAYNIAILPFPFSITAYAQPGRHFPNSDRLPADLNFILQLSRIFPFDSNTRNSYTQQASLGLGYQFKANAISLNYQFVRGIKLPALRNINPIINSVPGNPILGAITGRIDPKRGDVLELETAFDSYYHSFTIEFYRPFINRIGLLVSYTFSKAIDNFTDVRPDLQETANPLDLSGERGLSLQDIRNRFVFSGIWKLNYGRNPLLRNYQLAAIITLESGQPYNLLTGIDIDGNGDFLPGDRPTSIARNAGIKPGFANIDLRLSRNFTVEDRFKGEIIAEVFNLFNRVNISEVDRFFPPDVQGNFTLPPKKDGRFIVPRTRHRNAFTARQFQLGLRFTF